MNLEEHNLREIEGLSQRGRTLSIVDLINANTLDVDMAAFSLYAIANGASFLTAARPGNAGKTTLMACLLTFLPPESAIVTISNPSVVTQARRLIDGGNAENLCFLCHEIGAGRWYGYLWGGYVGQLMRLMNDGCRVVSCIHADTLPELRNIMVSRELSVLEEDFSRLGLILFMKLERGLAGYRRRVATLYEGGGGSGNHELLFSWKPESDTYSRHGESALLKRIGQQRGLSEEQIAGELQKCRDFIENLMASGNTDFRWVRKQVVDFCPENWL